MQNTTKSELNLETYNNLSNCCENCFRDSQLISEIQIMEAAIVGCCSFCSSTNAKCIEPDKLSIYFEMLLGAYSANDSGTPLTELIQNDWAIFNEDIDIYRQHHLLGEILQDHNIPVALYAPEGQSQNESLEFWEKFKEEIIQRNRWFAESKISPSEIELLLHHLILHKDELQENWFRARKLSYNDKMFPIDKMGAPPSNLAKHGRANPLGIAYLYLGSNEITAISEVRPHKGQVVAVAKFSFPEIDKLKILDLRHPRTTISPFGLDSEDHVAKMREDIQLLENFGNELSFPASASENPLEYIPTQYLCELIKNVGFDGVVYRSSLGDGDNLAIFNPRHAKAIEVTRHVVDDINISINQ